MLNTVRKSAQKLPWLREFIAFKIVPSGLFDSYIVNKELNDYWQVRLNDIVACNDNSDIVRANAAGKVLSGKQIMHNGLKIHLGSYYGPEIAHILAKNKGVHEPQEEKVFQEVLKAIPTNSTMIEMGAFWSFYSMWFNREITGAQNYMIEPESFNMKCGMRNFKLNDMTGDFTQALIGAESSEIDGVKTVCVDDFLQSKGIDFVHILHSDIQGYEYDMLQGAAKSIENGRIGFIFISTHNDEVHNKCRDHLIALGFSIIAESNMQDTFSDDGLIVAHSSKVHWNTEITIDLKSKYS